MSKAAIESLRVGALALLSSVALSSTCAGQSDVPEVKGPSGAPAFTDGVVSMGTLDLHLHCAGEGAPLVVFESGNGDDGTVWRWVQRDVARITRTCAYDRAGLGNSEPGQKPRTSQHMADELHALLQEAHQPAPYVLVGHSAGGLNVRLFASGRSQEPALPPMGGGPARGREHQRGGAGRTRAGRVDGAKLAAVAAALPARN